MPGNHQPKRFCSDLEIPGDEIHVVNVINCNHPNSDSISLPRNKQLPALNGVMPSMEDTADDKTLPGSPYYPDHATQHKTTSSLPQKSTASPTSPLGLPVPMAHGSHSNNSYETALIVNEHSRDFKAKQQPHYPLSDLPALVKLSPTSGGAPTDNTGQSPNGPEFFEIKASILTENSDLKSYSQSGQNEETADQPTKMVTNQQHLQYRLQQQPSNVFCSADNDAQGCEVSTPPPPKRQSSHLEHNMPNPTGYIAPGTQEGWIDLNATSATQHHVNQPQTWSNFTQNQTTETHMHTNPTLPGKGQILNGYNFSPPPVQAHHNIDTESRDESAETLSGTHQSQKRLVNQQICLSENQPKQIPPLDFTSQQRLSKSNQQYRAHQQHHDTQSQSPQQLPKQQPMEGNAQSGMFSLTYRSQRPPDSAETGLNPSSTSHPFSDPPRPESKPLPKDTAQQQRQYSPSPNIQYSQQNPRHQMPGSLCFQQAQQQQLQAKPDQMFPKTESQKESCLQFQREPGAQGDIQRHATLRMHLLQKQERPTHPQSPNIIRPKMEISKNENGSRFDALIRMPTPQLQHQHTVVKGERPSSTACWQNQQRSILSTMEQKFQQYQTSTAFERKSLTIKSPNKVKLEMSGGVTVVSTNLERHIEDNHKPLNNTPKKEPGLQCFLESPMKLLNTPIKNLLDTPNKTQYEIPSCHCVGKCIKHQYIYYTKLKGTGSNIV